MTHSAAPFDLHAVEAFMTRTVPGFDGPLTAEKFAGGQSNPTFRLTSPSGTYVLRRKPPGALLKSAHAVDREFRVQRALAGTDVPVATMLALCEDDGVIGSMFYVMEHVEARHFDDPRTPELTRDERAAVFDSMNATIAAIHTVDLDAVGLSDYGRPGDYFARQIDRWSRQYRASETVGIPAMERLIAWLTANLPPDDGRRTLVHGDFRLDNLLFHRATPRVKAVLDWELSTLGHPFADLAAILMQWRLEPGPARRGLAGVDRAAAGIPSDAEFVEAYCRRTGMAEVPKLDFPIAFCFFRMAAILQGIEKRRIDGNASNPERAAAAGALVPIYAAMGLETAHGG